MQVLGKSTLVKYLVTAMQAEFNLSSEVTPIGEKGDDFQSDFCYCAYTGKACQVLQKKGNYPVKTIHKLLWEFSPKKDGGFYKRKKETLSHKIVIIDEASMIDAELLKELSSHKETHFIFLGDPGQLPPIMKDKGQTGYDLLQSPHIFLDEVMRQASESEIIQLSMKIRNGEPLELYKGKEVQVISKDEVTTGHLLWADQILCATNLVRMDLNNQVRQLKGFGTEPEDGDKIICLRNYWKNLSSTGQPLVNGVIGTLRDPFVTEYNLPFTPIHFNMLQADFELDEGEESDNFYSNLSIDYKEIKTGEKTLNFEEEQVMKRKHHEDLIPMEFAYGYAITCHKSQGSEWDNVLVFEENFPYSKEEHKRWLYTACTRAAKKLVVVKA